MSAFSQTDGPRAAQGFAERPAVFRGAATEVDLPPFAVVCTLGRGGALGPLVEALAGQSGLDGRRITLFAALPDLRPARTLLAALPEGDEVELRLLRPPPGAGSARLAALDAATAFLEAQDRAEDAVLLLTDAVARPAPDWVQANLAALSRGADVVCGALVPRAEACGSQRVRSLAGSLSRYRRVLAWLEGRLDPTPCDPAPRHGYESGASLGLRLSALRRAGGAPDLPVLADRHLVHRLALAGAAIRHAPEVRVMLAPERYLELAADMPGASAAGSLAVTDPDHLAALWRERAVQRRRLGVAYAGLPRDERERAVRAALALTTPALPWQGAQVPVEVALRRLGREPVAATARRSAADEGQAPPLYGLS